MTKNKILSIILMGLSFIVFAKWIQWAETNVQTSTAYPLGLWIVAVGLFITGISFYNKK